MRIPQSLLEAIVDAARELPRAAVDCAADRMTDADKGEWSGVRASVLDAVVPIPQRQALERVLTTWRTDARCLSGEAVASAMRAASVGLRTGSEQKTEIVWTGPDTGKTEFRRTDQALLEVIRSAGQELLVVTFAAYKVPDIRHELLEAARRRVRIRFVAESAEASGGKVAFDALAALGPEVAERMEVYVWPLDRRPTDSDGHHGSLHAKCAVADQRKLLISSANLTDYAMTLNLELGLMLTGGPLPGRIVERFDRLIGDGVLVRVG